MTKEINDLLGSLFGTANEEGSPNVCKSIMKLFRKRCREEHNIQVNLFIIKNDNVFEGQIEHMAVHGSGNNIAKTINCLFNPPIDKDHGK